MKRKLDRQIKSVVDSGEQPDADTGFINAVQESWQ